jgi:hypothetical protein
LPQPARWTAKPSKVARRITGNGIDQRRIEMIGQTEMAAPEGKPFLFHLPRDLPVILDEQFDRRGSDVASCRTPPRESGMVSPLLVRCPQRFGAGDEKPMLNRRIHP